MSVNDEEDPMDLVEDDLFGDDDDDGEEEEVVEKTRELDDEDLDSGDDETRHDRDGDRRMQDVDSEPGIPSLQSVLYQNIPRHQTPKPSNGQVSILAPLRYSFC